MRLKLTRLYSFWLSARARNCFSQVARSLLNFVVVVGLVVWLGSRCTWLMAIVCGCSPHRCQHQRRCSTDHNKCELAHDFCAAGCVAAGAGCLASGRPYAVACPQRSPPRPRRMTRSRYMSESTSPSPASRTLVEHISAQAGSLPSARRFPTVLLHFRFTVVLLGPASTERAFVHLATQTERARLRELRRAERQA